MVRRGFYGTLLIALGALVPGSIIAHGVHLDAAQVRLAARNGAWFVQNPRSNEGNRVGYAGNLSQVSTVALGVDGWDPDMAVEQAALAILRERKPNRTLETNVEFYTALLLEALGFTPDSFTCVFALGRTTGWLAHAKEQIAGGRLIRPQSVYVGPQPRQAARVALLQEGDHPFAHLAAQVEQGGGVPGADQQAQFHGLCTGVRDLHRSHLPIPPG